MAPLPVYLVLAAAVLSVSFAAPLFRLADAPALTASFWRLAFAVLLLAPFAWRARGAWRAYTRSDWLWTAVAGAALGAHFALWVTSLSYISVAASVSLVTLQAVFVALGGHFILRDRLGAMAWTGVAVAMAGAFVVAGADGLGTDEPRGALLGSALALLGGVGSAAYMLVGRRLRRRHGLIAYVTPVYAAAALAVLLALPLVGQPLAADVGGHAFVLFVLLAAVPMLGGHTLANWCLRHVQAHVVATWILLEPVGAALIAWPLLGEVPGRLTVLGGLLVIAGAWLTVRPAPGAAARAAAAPR